jgi:hypothetical protein
MPQLQVQRSRVGRASHAQPKPIKRLTLTVTLTVIMFMTVHVESLVMLTSSLVDESVLVRLHLHVHLHVGAVGRREEKVILVASRLPELLRRRILRLRFAFLLAFLILLLWFRGFLDSVAVVGLGTDASTGPPHLPSPRMSSPHSGFCAFVCGL